VCIFENLRTFNFRFGAKAAMLYGSGSIEMMLPLEPPAPDRKHEFTPLL
jgi:hypothetical protein